MKPTAYDLYITSTSFEEGNKPRIGGLVFGKFPGTGKLRDLTGASVYIKEDADVYIADLESRVRAGEEQITNLINSASGIMLFQDKVKDDKCAELYHANYKRCVAMAKWCLGKCSFLCPKSEFYGRWYHRWLKLSEHYKGASI